MNKQELETLKALLEKFVSQDYFGMSEMNEIQTINDTIELVDGAIINFGTCEVCGGTTCEPDRFCNNIPS